MSDFVQFLALCAVTAGSAIAFGASLRLALDAWQDRETERDILKLRDRLYEILDREEL